MAPDNYEQCIAIMEKALSVGAGLDLGLDFKRDIFNLPTLLGQKYDRSNMISTGMKGLDEVIGGGWINGTLSLVAGAPGGGKSRAMAAFTAEALKQGKKVVFITLELDDNETMANVTSSLTGLNWWDMLSSDPELKAEYIRRAEAASELIKDANLKTKFYINKSISSQTIISYLMRLKSQEHFEPDLLVVDYMDLLLPVGGENAKFSRNEESNYDMLGTVCFDLIKVAKMFKIPVLSGTQLGRAAWDLSGKEVVSMASVSESAKKAFNAHNLITINRTSAEKDLGKARFYTAKARTGTSNAVVYSNFDLLSTSLFSIATYDNCSSFCIDLVIVPLSNTPLSANSFIDTPSSSYISVNNIMCV